MADRGKSHKPAPAPIESPFTPTPEQGTPGALPDGTALSAEHAALYLCMLPAQLADLRKIRRADGSRSNGPAIIETGTVSANQAVHYRVGALREFDKSRAATPSPLDAALNAGLLAWVSAKLPFFAELDARERRGPRTLIGCAWDKADPAREQRLAELAQGRIRFVWITPAEASTSRWADLAAHRALAAKGQALLTRELGAIEAGIQASELLSRS
ncbi:hypothetical protein AAFF27_20000 [Xylophilus sp. GW821-FHT01B05]